MQAMYIQRHDSAVRKIHNALRRRTRNGGVYTILDACRETQLAEQGAAAKRLPRWMLPADTTSDALLSKLRPDILRVLELPAAPTDAEIQHAIANKGQYTIQVVEVGFCSDTRWRDRVANKLAQHDTLMEALQQAGWKVDEHPQIIVLGACGASYLSGQQALERLGLTKKKCSGLLTDLHLIAVHAAHDISMARRRLERRTGVG